MDDLRNGFLFGVGIMVSIVCIPLSILVAAYVWKALKAIWEGFTGKTRIQPEPCESLQTEKSPLGSLHGRSTEF